MERIAVICLSFVLMFIPIMGVSCDSDGDVLWSEMNRVSSDVSENRLLSVWGTSSSDVFAVGDTYSYEWNIPVALIMHYDGSSWSEVYIENTQSLSDVWGSSSSDVFTVGLDETVLHYNGISWSEITGINTENNLNAIWGYSDSDIFIVGNVGTILHYDGNSWSEMSSGSTEHLVDIWGSSSDDVFAVGWDGTILHYDGSNWSQMESGTTDYVDSVWGSSSTDVYAVGHPSNSILHYDGNSWSCVTIGTPDITYYQLYSIWGSSSSDVFVVGESVIVHEGRYDSQYHIDPIIFHYDGNSWSEMDSGTSMILEDVWGSSPSDVFAVGGATILHYTGQSLD